MPLTLKQQHRSHSFSVEQSNIQQVLQSIKLQTEQRLDQSELQDIKAAMLLKQATTYQLMLLDPHQYIAHQFTKLRGKDDKKQAISGVDLLTQKFLLSHQVSDKPSPIVLKNLSSQSFNFNQLNNELKQKLFQISANLDSIKLPKSTSRVKSLSKSFSLSDRKHPSEQNPHNLLHIEKHHLKQNLSQLMQFKQPSYWLKNQQKTKKIKQFLEHHRKQRHQHHQRYQQSVQKSWQRLQEEKQKQLQAKLQFKKQILKKGLEKTLQYKQRRENNSQLHENQLQKIQQFLEKLHPNQESKRLYQLLEENYQQRVQKQHQEYQQKLQKIRQLHAPLDPQQLQEHLQKYEEYKQSLKDESQQKKQQFNQHLDEIKEELASLFHGKRYKKVAQEIQSPYKRSFSEIVKRKSKKKQFALNVKEKFKPNVSEKKRQQLQQSIRLLELSQDKTKRKVFKNGELQFQEKQQIDRRKKGLEYLAFLRKYLQSKPKKQHRPISTSVLQSPVKKIDYLRQNKPQLKFKASLVEWKKVMEDEKFNPKDKYTFLKESISTLEHKAIEKEIEARNLKKSPLELEKKDQFDKYYIQSIEAKMAILNNLMLKSTKK